jgi:hypothetical protein
MSKEPTVISHWHNLIENFQTSPMWFYQSLEAAVQRRYIPEIHGARIEHKEGGLASASRQYVRFHRGKTAFDICAAPFGTGFFVSWWFNEPPLRFGILYTLAFLFAVAFAMNFAFGVGFAIGAAAQGYAFGILLGFGGAFVGVPLVLWLLGNALRQGLTTGESIILAMPLIGWIYERIFAPPTFYALDTALMFQDAVHNAVLEVMDGITASNGVRALTGAERKPILKRFGPSA